MKKIIYSLNCPLTNEVHYVGKSSNGIFRPEQHLKESHSEKLEEWISELKSIGQKPKIEILEVVPDENSLEDRELYWIHKFIKRGSYLFNVVSVTPTLVSDKLKTELEDLGFNDLSHIAKYVKERRKIVGLNQEEFADRCGIALTVLRKIEQNKTNYTLDSLLTVLSMFGTTIDIKKVNVH